MIYLGEAESHTEYHRGDIFYIHREAVSYGHEQRPGRPAVIVSNDFINQNSTVLEVVYLTTKEKRVSPTHIVIESSLRRSTVLCEQITSVDKEFVGNYIGRCTEEEMRKIDYALVISLALKKAAQDADPAFQSRDYEREASEMKETIERLQQALQAAKEEADRHKWMLDYLLKQIGLKK